MGLNDSLWVVNQRNNLNSYADIAIPKTQNSLFVKPTKIFNPRGSRMRRKLHVHILDLLNNLKQNWRLVNGYVAKICKLVNWLDPINWPIDLV